MSFNTHGPGQYLADLEIGFTARDPDALVGRPARQVSIAAQYQLAKRDGLSGAGKSVGQRPQMQVKSTEDCTLLNLHQVPSNVDKHAT